MISKENYETIKRELLWHAVLPQHQIVKKYNLRYGLDADCPEQKVLELMKEKDDSEPLPMELLLDTYRNDDSADIFLRNIRENDQNKVGLFLVASIARRYVGFRRYNLLKYRTMIDIGLESLAKALEDHTGESEEILIANVAWRIHRAICSEFLKRSLVYQKKEIIPAVIKASQVETALKNEQKYHLEEQAPPSDAIAFFDSKYQEKDVVLSSLLKFYDNDEQIKQWLVKAEQEPSLSKEEENNYILKIKMIEKEEPDSIPGSLFRLVADISSEYDIFYNNNLQYHSGFGGMSRFIGILKDERRAIQLLSILELLQVGIEGLYKAIQLFDKNTTYSVRSFAAWWIHKTIVRNVLVPMVYLESSQFLEKAMAGISSAVEDLQKKGHEPTWEEFMEQAGDEFELAKDYLYPDLKRKQEQELQLAYKQELHLEDPFPTEKALQAIRKMSKPQSLDLSNLKNKLKNDGELSEYIEKLASVPQLIPEEEKALFYQYKTGNQKAKEVIVKANLSLCVDIVDKYFKDNRFVNTEIFKYLVFDGNEGLEQAVEAYDEKEDGDFQTFAAWYIHRRVNAGFALGVNDTNTIEDLYHYVRE